ncbi:MAG: GNAT family N-acetyltransferase [Heliobacteriaceae bacterium]|nr:GNAT family N-acetyltransferase [Heliobacteriaceae bacterium]
MTEKDFDVRLLTEKDFEGFAEIYEDFKCRAVNEYQFELEPLNFEGFTDAVKQEFINCIVLYENTKPAAFLVYTTIVSEAVELNIIHSYKMENTAERTKILIGVFLKLTKDERKNRVVCYPMLGAQKEFVSEIPQFGFKFLGIAVLRFMMQGSASGDIFRLNAPAEPEDCYKIVTWDEAYAKDAVEVVHEAFKTSADILFDPRFKTLRGTQDVIDKIVNNIYAEFLPEATSVLLYNGLPAGFCFMNLTGGTIANIPIVAIRKQHQGKGLSKYLLKNSVEKILEQVDSGERPITEINTTTETNNFQALKMYRHLGFREDYTYPQAYLPAK